MRGWHSFVMLRKTLLAFRRREPLQGDGCTPVGPADATWNEWESEAFFAKNKGKQRGGRARV